MAVLVMATLLCSVYNLSAQTIMGSVSGDPSALLDLKSTDRGVLMPRMTTAERSAIANPAEGLLVFNTSLNCLEMNAGSSSSPNWICLLAATGQIASLDCAAVTVDAAPVAGEEVVNINFYVPYTGGNGSVHSGQTLVSTGVTGLTARLAPGILVYGDTDLVYHLSGTPSGSGTASFLLDIAGQSCTVDITVEETAQR